MHRLSAGLNEKIIMKNMKHIQTLGLISLSESGVDWPEVATEEVPR